MTMAHDKSVIAIVLNVVQQLITQLGQVFSDEGILKICPVFEFGFRKQKFISFFETHKPRYDRTRFGPWVRLFAQPMTSMYVPIF